MRRVKQWMAWVGVLTALAAAGTAGADDQERRQPRFGRGNEGRPIEMPRREAPPEQMRQFGPQQRPRLSPEERRQLRRDVQDADQEIYRRNR